MDSQTNPYLMSQNTQQMWQSILVQNTTAFSLTNKELFNHLDQFLAYLDEPMADSSALNVFLLSQETKKHVTVSLSGDGADEL